MSLVLDKLQPYTSEETEYAQREIDRHRSEILRELDLQHEKFPEIYQASPLFCLGAREGCVISGQPVMHAEQMRVYGILVKYPCFCYYGAGCNFQPGIGWARTKQARSLFHRDSRSEKAIEQVTAIESFLFVCSNLEYSHRNGKWEHSPLRPIPWENPALQLLVALIEEHQAVHSLASLTPE
jgi:hypothetical protein